MKKLVAIVAVAYASFAMGAGDSANNQIEVVAHNDSQDAHSYINVSVTEPGNGTANASGVMPAAGATAGSAGQVYNAITFDVWDAETGWWYGDDRPRGTVGYFTYDPEAPENAERGIIGENDKFFTVHNITPTTQIGFFTTEGGDAKATEQLALIVPSALNDQEAKGPYIADFDTLRDLSESDVGILLSGTGYTLNDHGFISGWTSPAGATGGYGRDWMGFRPRISSPSGAPLPGALAVVLVGSLGAGALKLRKRRS